jgi:hypothetical protein
MRMDNETQDTEQASDEGNADQGSGDRPDSPKDATTPPGNPDPDPERVKQAEEDAERTKPY